MKRRLALGSAVAAAAAALAVAAPAVATASPVEPHPVVMVGSANICFNIPVGPLKITIC